MGCTNCSTGPDGLPKGCKNNGICGTGGCNKLSVFDWLSNMELPEGQKPFDGVEIQFKNSRKEFFRNTQDIPLSIGDIVATETSPGHDIGVVTLIGELVKVQMKKKKVDPYSDDLPKIYRKANQRDVDVWQEVKDKEETIKKRSREIAIRLNLRMKISDVEFQGDGSKVVFYYTAESRVDFRQLIKEFAYEFKTRIEMKQIGFRQEASRLGGIGSCGRELCCSTWLTDFRSVKTSAARYQQLSLNPQKLAGQCGKLKCCLNYELDSYLDAIKSFPKFEDKLVTQKGNAICQKVDIFRKKMWYAYEAESNNWHEMDLDKVLEIVEAQKNKQPVASLEDFKTEVIIEVDSVAYGNVVGQDSLTRFDQPKKNKPHNKKRPPNQQNKVTRDSPRANSSQENPIVKNTEQGPKKKPFKKKRPNPNKQNNPPNKEKDA